VRGLIPLLILIFVMILMLVSCSPYETPKVGSYPIILHVVKDAKSVKKSCESSKAMACAYDKLKPCPIYVDKDTWEIPITEEIAHCLDIYTHN